MLIVWINASFISIKEYLTWSTPDRSTMENNGYIDGGFESENLNSWIHQSFTV